MKFKKNKLVVATGVVLFFLCLILRSFTVGEFSFNWIASEIFFVNYVFYIFIAVLFPIILLVVGKYVESLEEKIRVQHEEFEQARRLMDVGKNMLESKNKELSTEVMIDPLTQLHNRKFVQQMLDREIQTVLQSKPIDPTLFAMMIDVDNFKHINDTYGHGAGDAVLKELSNILKRSIRGMDLVGRLGGDEFVIVTPETNSKAVKLIANRVRQNVNDYAFLYGEETLEVHLSIGVSAFDSLDQKTSECFMQKVDECLLEAKRLGKNQIVIN